MMDDIDREVCGRAEGAITNKLIEKGDKLVKRTFHDPGITLHFEGPLGYSGKPVKYTVDIRYGHEDVPRFYVKK